MKKWLLSTAFAVTLAHPAAQADDSVRAAQAVLQSAGYYTGSLDGELNAETKAALRRYQIRNQLEPSGELTPETSAALNKESQAAPAPAAPSVAPSAPSVPEAVTGVPVGDGARYDKIFARTPYETAAVESQFKTVRKAQLLLAQRRLYEGPVDGRPSAELEEALLRFQSARELPRTGRLDIDTLAELHLLPVSKLQRPGCPYEAPTPRGAVRGEPVD